MLIWETIKDNWFEILVAVSTIINMFMPKKNKPTKEERQELKAERQELKAKKLETKAAKDLDKAKAKFEKASKLKKGE